MDGLLMSPYLHSSSHFIHTMSSSCSGCGTSSPPAPRTTSSTSSRPLRWWRRFTRLWGSLRGWPGHSRQWAQRVLVGLFDKLPDVVVQVPLSLWVQSSWHNSIRGRLWQACVWRPQGESVLLALRGHSGEYLAWMICLESVPTSTLII